MSETEDALQHVLHLAPYAHALPISQRPAFFLVSPPGLDGAVFSRHFAKDNNAEYLSLTVLDQLVNADYCTASLRDQVAAYLLSGEELPTETVLKVLEAAINSDHAKFRGFVLEGLSQLEPDALILRRLIENCLPSNLSPILIQLQMPKDDAFHTLLNQYTDFETNLSYSATLVELSRAAAIIEEPADSADEEDEDAEPEPEQFENENADEECDDAGNPIIPPFMRRIKVVPLTVNGPEPEILSQDVLDRLVQDPKYSTEKTKEAWNSYSLFESALVRVHEALGPMRSIKADATQHMDVLRSDVQDRLATVDWSLSMKASPCIRIGDEALTAGLSSLNAKSKLENLDLLQGEPPREWSVWQDYCPVSFSEYMALVQGKPTCSAAYKGHLYFFYNEPCLNKFIASPEKYLSTPPRLIGPKFCLLGGPLCGKTSQAVLLSKLYGLKLINVDAILAQWDKSPDQEACASQTPIYKSIVESCQKGAAVASSQLAEVVKWAIDEAMANVSGWILDGFPYTVEQANALVSIDIKPDFVITLQSDPRQDKIASRAALKQSDWRTGQISTGPMHDSTSISTYPNLTDLYGSFQVDNLEISKILIDKPITITPEDVVSTCVSIRRLVDPFVLKAVVPSESISDLAILGPCKDYCPIRLIRDRVLVKGNRDFAIKWQSKYYFCSSLSAQKDFISNPVMYSAAPSSIPPPRFLFMGARGAGKTTCAKALLSPFKVPTVSLSDIVRENLTTLSKDDRETLTSTGDPILDPSSQTLVDLVSTLYTKEPYASQGFGLLGFPRSKTDIDCLFAAGLYPDAIINLRVDAETSARRLLGERKMEIVNDDQEAAMREELLATAENVLNSLSEAVGSIEPSPVLMIHTDCNRVLRPILASLKVDLRRFLDARPSLLSNVVPIDYIVADGLLARGIGAYSSHGQYCPVTLSKNKLITSDLYGKIPAMIGNHIYFLADDAALQEFMIDSQQYICRPPVKPAVRPIVSIIGGPKSGKTALAQRLAGELGMAYVDAAAAITSLLQDNREPCLAKQTRKTLLSGEAIQNQLAGDVLLRVLSRTACRSHGAIVDGFPLTVKDAELMEAKGLVPNLFIEIRIEEANAFNRMNQDHGAQMTQQPFVSDFLPGSVKKQHELYSANINELRHWVNSSYHGWEIMDGARSKWSLTAITKNCIEKAIDRRQRYVWSANNCQPVAVYACGIHYKHMNSHLGLFGHYCPVNFVDHDDLVPGASGTTTMAEFDGYYYRMASSKELAVFLSNPRKYTESGKRLPTTIPVRRSVAEVRAMFPKQVELQGYDPVILTEGPPGLSSVVPGEAAFTVEWDSKLYQMASEELAAKFIKSPWRYTKAVLPAVLPPRKVQIPVASLPLVGYLEHTVSNALTDALTAVGKARPKYPFRNMASSASQYLGLCLKANNPKSKAWTRERWLNKLKQFEGACELVHEVRQGVTEDYRDIVKRADGFDVKLDRFFGLRDAGRP
ncbi:adenylate kinase [Synchytrium endobioticum]|uniref:Adenylate kinase n=1 Tax=Synchytrium endobioticum TaxID=286115 RepID=A0A507CRK3_9FUNG|nr:adenylate kinase [Synchytrium endobioticum]TPX42665.1 adenylate kinase [Synchytrium endobioticum]